jgi:hypothetical protein
LDRRRPGIVIIKPDPPFGLKITPDQWLYLFTLAVLIVCSWSAGTCCGRVGRAMVAIRDHPIAADAMGVNSALFKTLTFGVVRLYRRRRRARGDRGAVRGARQLYRRAVDQLPGGHRRRGVASISGALYGALFIQFVPNFADQISKAALGHLRCLPAGLCLRDADRCSRLRAHGLRQAGGPADWRYNPAQPGAKQQEERRMKSSHVLIALLAGATLGVTGPAVAQKKYDPGASDTEIKVGQTMPYSGPASAYGTIGKSEVAYFQMINEQGGVNGRKVNLISLMTAHPPDGGADPPPGRAGRSAGRLPEPGHAQQHGDPEVPQCQAGAAAVRGDRGDQVG